MNDCMRLIHIVEEKEIWKDSETDICMTQGIKYNIIDLLFNEEDLEYFQIIQL